MKQVHLPYAAGMTWWLGTYWLHGERLEIQVPAFTREGAEVALRQFYPVSRIDRRADEEPR